jgi:hypothetical protein
LDIPECGLPGISAEIELDAGKVRGRSDSLKILGLAAKYLVISLAVLYVVDWLVFEARQLRGTGLRTVSVEQYLATPLKGSKAEYDYMGAADEDCSRALFPQYAKSTWNPPCWWLEKHNQRWE